MRRPFSNNNHDPRGSGDNQPITVKVIDTSSNPSTATIHKLSRGEICKTLTNIRDYLNANVTPNETLNKKSSSPHIDQTVYEDFKDHEIVPPSSENFDFLDYDYENFNAVDFDETGLRSLIASISEPVDYDAETEQHPWILEYSNDSFNSPSSSKPRKPKNSEVSNSNYSSNASKCFRETPPSTTRPRWQIGSKQKSVYTSEYSYYSGTIPPSSVDARQGYTVGPSKPSATRRFQRFLARTRKPVARSGVNVCVQPEIAPEVMAAIQEMFDTQYGPQTNASNLYNYEWNYGDAVDMEQGDYQTQFERNGPKFERNMNYAQGQQGSLSNYHDHPGQEDCYHPEQTESQNPDYRDDTTSRIPHPELLDFPPEPNYLCHKRRTKYTLNNQPGVKLPYHGPNFRHTHPNPPIPDSYQILMNEGYDNCENPPPPHCAQQMYYDQNQHPQLHHTTQEEHYYETNYINDNQRDFVQQPNDSEPQNQPYHYEFMGY